MRVIGLHEVAIADITLPANFERALEGVDLESRAQSISEIGVIHEPIVRERDMILITGRQRLAAVQRLGRTTITVKLVECTDREAIELEYQENIHRKHDPKYARELMQERIALLAKEAQEAQDAREASEPRPRGRPKTAHGKARDQFAGERGVLPSSVRQAERRAKLEGDKPDKPKRANAAEQHVTDKDGSCIRTLHMRLSEQFLAQVKVTQGHLRSAAKSVRAARRELALLEQGDLGMSPGRIAGLLESSRQLASALEGALPSSVCPYCKAIDGLQQECTGCDGAGFIGKDQESAVPKELWRDDRPLVYVQGVQHYVSEFLDAEPEPPPEELSTESEEPWRMPWE
jgi:hypothetical protein